MKKGIILCSGGFSTTIIAQKLNDINDQNIKFEAYGMSGSNWEGFVDYKTEIVLLSPQISFMHKTIIEQLKPRGIKVFAIPPLLYNPVKCDQLWEEIKKV